MAREHEIGERIIATAFELLGVMLLFGAFWEIYVGGGNPIGPTALVVAASIFITIGSVLYAKIFNL